ncbi:hypothetical protein Bhyg_13862 [Pseudolycoriella hygida]|uniref:Uncharacterized protein n=1 Tax=Pseudolycoriella hygida TaxID=35572 RepID=A0A9Q0RWQ8_9DIPT|nr:hypothetical protein Bhyg_13862 [Pseudolycoriella hygida]
MAVPFFVPDGDDQRSNGSSPQTQSTISSATQTPLQSPINDAHLVQAFYEALSLYSANMLQATPGCFSPPLSPTCCQTHNNYRGDVFFPETSSSHSTPTRLDRSQRWRSTRDNTLRRRFSSSGDEVHNDTESVHDYPMVSGANIPVSAGPVDYNLEEHYTFLAAREHLEPFAGQVPPIKKKKTMEQSETDSPHTPKAKEPNLVWPTVVTAVVLAVGCGFLVTR